MDMTAALEYVVSLLEEEREALVCLRSRTGDFEEGESLDDHLIDNDNASFTLAEFLTQITALDKTAAAAATGVSA